jgi:serine/threonine protein kinase
MSLSTGTHLDRFEIISPLGSGGMGEVYLAQDTRLKRKVALKLLPAQFTRDEDRVRRFEHEAQAASALNHPNIITIHEIGQVGSSHFIAAEFIAGQTLRQRLAQEKLGLRSAFDVTLQMASALSRRRGPGGIWQMPVAGGEERQVPELLDAGYWRYWAVLDDGIYFVAPVAAGRPAIKFFSFATHAVTQLGVLERDPLQGPPGLTISPDGRWLAVCASGSERKRSHARRKLPLNMSCSQSQPRLDSPDSRQPRPVTARREP